MDKNEELELKANIFGSFFLIANKLQIIGDSFLGELTTKQWFTIAVISKFFVDYKPTLSEVASFTGTSRQNTKQIALKLYEKGFLNIEKDEKDSRALRLSLTEKVYEYSEKRGNKDTDFINSVFYDFSEEELKSMFIGLNKFINNIEQFK
ncbi:MAG: MarR family winged helix-turn-helix transcriptional regulator [Sarcina sp.]